MNREKQREREDIKWENCCIVKYSIIGKRHKGDKIVKKSLKKRLCVRARASRRELKKKQAIIQRERDRGRGRDGGRGVRTPSTPTSLPLPFLEDKWLMVSKQCFFPSLSQNLPSWLPLGWQLSIRAPLVWRTALYCRQLMLSFCSQIRLECYHERSNSQ